MIALLYPALWALPPGLLLCALWWRAMVRREARRLPDRH